jgi:hypothetical protein
MISNLEHVSPLGKSDHCVLNFDFNCYANICTQPKTTEIIETLIRRLKISNGKIYST